MARKKPQREPATLDVSALHGSRVTLGVVLTCFGVLLAPMGALLWISNSANERIAKLEEHMKDVDTRLGEAASDLKEILKHGGIVGPVAQPTSVAPSPTPSSAASAAPPASAP